MTSLVFLFGLLLGAALGYWVVRRKSRRKFLLHLEYWVYLPGESLPPQDDAMSRLVETRAIGSSEATLFSDVRLHIALVLRAKNAHVFRPDLLEPHVDATAEQLATLGESRSLAKVRFLSEEPIPDRRYLTFLPQVARTLAEMGGGSLLYDVVGERLLAAEDLKGGDPGVHVRWVPEPTGGYVRTHGLTKVGLPEIRTAAIQADERWIVSEVIGKVSEAAWRSGALPEEATVEAFEDRFRVSLEFGRDGLAHARVHRYQAT